MENISDVSLDPLISSAYVKPLRMKYKQNGISKIWDLVSLHESVSIIVFNTDRKRLIAVKQFRPGAGNPVIGLAEAAYLQVFSAVYFSHLPESMRSRKESIDTQKILSSEGITLEFCAGIVDKAGDLVKIAKGEVVEECGYDVPLKKFEKVKSFRSGIGVSGEKMTLFYVEVNDSMKVSEGGGLESEGEMIDVVELSISEGEELLRKPDVKCPAGFLFGLMWFMKNKAHLYTKL